ncbi:hypothetical protein CRG98_008078 [Punica granatum]|uniref:Retrotransposon Copia-like N-terminal domain-containing protein n=1 Tax=Punica granatum TaxID=22663 RepID=A0A2I0KSW0_PUNGR|nr:hypothetical protein CRG98_008078 [Punica granatum]
MAWAKATEIALRAKNKLGFVDGTLKRPADGDPMKERWDSYNWTMISWIINTIEQELQSSVVYADNVKALWDDLRESQCRALHGYSTEQGQERDKWKKPVAEMSRRKEVMNSSGSRMGQGLKQQSGGLKAHAAHSVQPGSSKIDRLSKNLFQKLLNIRVAIPEQANGVADARETLQQNGRVERKHRHFLNVARALLFQASLPKYFWGECVIGATPLINMTLTSIIGGERRTGLVEDEQDDKSGREEKDSGNESSHVQNSRSEQATRLNGSPESIDCAIGINGPLAEQKDGSHAQSDQHVGSNSDDVTKPRSGALRLYDQSKSAPTYLKDFEVRASNRFLLFVAVIDLDVESMSYNEAESSLSSERQWLRRFEH